jgi:hypothetical protein
VGRALRTLAIALLLGVIVVLLVGLMVSLARPVGEHASGSVDCRSSSRRDSLPACR